MAALEAELEALRQQQRAELLLTLAAAVGDRVFSARELWRHARQVSRELREAFAEAGITSTRQLGKRLQRVSSAECPTRGLRLERVGVDHHVGALWVVRVLLDSPPDACPRQAGA